MKFRINIQKNLLKISNIQRIFETLIFIETDHKIINIVISEESNEFQNIYVENINHSTNIIINITHKRIHFAYKKL